MRDALPAVGGPVEAEGGDRVDDCAALFADLAVDGEDAREGGLADVEGGGGEEVGVDLVAEFAGEVEEEGCLWLLGWLLLLLLLLLRHGYRGLFRV